VKTTIGEAEAFRRGLEAAVAGRFVYNKVYNNAAEAQTAADGFNQPNYETKATMPEGP
jgi:hypothetical protein